MTDDLVDDNPALKDRYPNEEEWNEIKLLGHSSKLLHYICHIRFKHKLTSFDNETATIAREMLHNVYTSYTSKEIGFSPIAEDDSPSNYFRKHRIEKSNNVLEEYLTTAEENYRRRKMEILGNYLGLDFDFIKAVNKFDSKVLEDLILAN
ncbi:759_t:CDS:2 [Gigaspora margarita]|uniref:759_t:CDS:1 n=1 Tax=Gigaspora margarita TaxID=4874 RepID=A0ABN7UI20_GIGMA|nr:759_t:CDS:2 [Gigaspora margarita]